MDHSLSDAHFRDLVDHLPDAVLVHVDGALAFVNEAALVLFGARSPSDLLGTPMLSLVHPEDRDLVQDRIDRVVAHRAVQPLTEERFLRLDGSVVEVEVKTLPVVLGARAGVLVVVRDLSRRLKAERALAASERRLADLVADLPVGVVVHGPHLEILLGNPKAAELLGLTVDQLLGKTPYDPAWNCVHEDESPFPGDTHPASLALKTGRPVLGVVMGVYHPVIRDRVWLSVDAVPHRDPQGAVAQVVVTFVDVTEGHRAQQRVRALLDEKEVILKEVHHRIKNNMSTMKAILLLHADGLEDPRAREALADAENRLQSMMVLYDRLYRSDNFGRIRAAEYLGPLAREILANFPSAARVALELDLGDFDLDVVQLQPLGIIVNELLTNVMKYAFPGGRSGRVSLSAHRSDGRVEVILADDGAGLPPSVDVGKSRGFGLMLVDTLTRHLGGRIVLERGPGTRVRLQFPSGPP